MKQGLPQAIVLGLVFLSGVYWQGCQSHSKEITPQAPLTPVQTPLQLSDVKPLTGGKKLFAENCAACHGITGHGSSMVLQGKHIHFDDPVWQKHISDAEIKMTIRQGRGMMPAFETTLTESELNQLVQYIRSLGKTAS